MSRNAALRSASLVLIAGVLAPVGWASPKEGAERKSEEEVLQVDRELGEALLQNDLKALLPGRCVARPQGLPRQFR